MWSSAPNTWWLSHEPQLYFVLAYSTMLTCWNQMVNVVHNHYKWTSSCQTSQWLVSPQQVKLCDSVQSHKRNQSLLFDSRPSGTFDSVTVELSSELPAWRQTPAALCLSGWAAVFVSLQVWHFQFTLCTNCFSPLVSEGLDLQRI